MIFEILTGRDYETAVQGGYTDGIIDEWERDGVRIHRGLTKFVTGAGIYWNLADAVWWTWNILLTYVRCLLHNVIEI